MDDNDFVHPYLAPEVKTRAALPRWALECLEQARAGRSAGGKLPVLFLVGKRMRLADGLVVMRVADFQEIVGKIQP